MTDHKSTGNGEYPSGKPIVGIESVDVVIRFDECLLGNIFRILLVVNPTAYESINTVLKPI